MEQNEAVFSKAVNAGKKKYYLDVKKARNNSMYLSIREVAFGDEAGGGNPRKVIIFSDAIREFAAAFDEAKKFVPAKEKEAAVKQKEAAQAV
ncbi:MAG: DUF3276 family protein [Candidatus Goldiibacteriota bacterium]|jgi:hypothetical protein